MKSYEEIKEWKERNIYDKRDAISLNRFHDEVMGEVLKLAKEKIGEPPCSYVWFITGSGGRFEQGFISDQDHGMVYENEDEQSKEYFRRFGEEVSFGLDQLGYPYCTGKVMSSNPLWCKSQSEWQEQLRFWMEDGSFESIRYLQIFLDARALCGAAGFIHQLKSFLFYYQKEHPYLLKRFVDNVMHVKNGIGPLGQILVEQYGEHRGCVNLKYAAFLPYVNAVRLLSLREGVYETSTLSRINKCMSIGGYERLLQNAEKNFGDLLAFRMSLFRGGSYEDTHYVNVEKLTRDEKKDMKRILKDGKRIHDEVTALLKKDVANGN